MGTVTWKQFIAGALTAALCGAVIVAWGPEVAISVLVFLIMGGVTALVIIAEQDEQEDERRYAEWRRSQPWKE